MEKSIKTVKTKTRHMGLEWLRIVSMLMIILLHSIDHSGLYETLVPGTSIYYVEQFLYALVQVCVNCFILISGYFLVTSSFKLKKLGLLWVEVVFYALVIRVVMILLGQVDFSITSILSCFVPIITGSYWFITIYFGMYLLSPFYNIAINAMTKKQHRNLLLVLFFLLSVWISIHPAFKGMNSGNGWGLAWFTFLYFTASYFRRHYTPNGKWGKYFAIFLICPALMVIGLFVSNVLNIALLKSAVDNWWRYDSIFVYVASVSLLLMFLNINKIDSTTKFSKFISAVSASTFGVYLIHAHADVCIAKWWQFIGITSNVNAWWYVLYQLFVVVAIFSICVIIDCIRKQLFKVCRIDSAIKKLFDKIESTGMLLIHRW